MNRRLGLWLLLGAMAILVVAAFLGSQSGGSGPSALSRGREGLVAARLYLEARGAAVALHDRSFEDLEGGGVLVTAFPWRRLLVPGGMEPLVAWVQRGGTLIVAYSGQEVILSVEDGTEIPLVETQQVKLLELFGLDLTAARENPPLSPGPWRRYMKEEWQLTPVELSGQGAGAGVEPLVMPAPRSVPRAVAGAQVWYRHGESRRPAVFSVDRGRGRILVLPVTVLANAGLSRGGNADLLESLRRWLGDRWAFDEYHHGLVNPETVERTSRGAFDLIAVHLGLIYLLALLAMTRRFGPPWKEPPVRSGSTTAFLRGLGALHHRLGHHGAAAELLLERVRLLEPHVQIPEELEVGAGSSDGPGLVALAKAVARIRHEKTEGVS